MLLSDVWLSVVFSSGSVPEARYTGWVVIFSADYAQNLEWGGDQNNDPNLPVNTMLLSNKNHFGSTLIGPLDQERILPMTEFSQVSNNNGLEPYLHHAARGVNPKQIFFGTMKDSETETWSISQWLWESCHI